MKEWEHLQLYSEYCLVVGSIPQSLMAQLRNQMKLSKLMSSHMMIVEQIRWLPPGLKDPFNVDQRKGILHLAAPLFFAHWKTWWAIKDYRSHSSLVSQWIQLAAPLDCTIPFLSAFALRSYLTALWALMQHIGISKNMIKNSKTYVISLDNISWYGVNKHVLDIPFEIGHWCIG